MEAQAFDGQSSCVTYGSRVSSAEPVISIEREVTALILPALSFQSDCV